MFLKMSPMINLQRSSYESFEKPLKKTLKPLGYVTYKNKKSNHLRNELVKDRP